MTEEQLGEEKDNVKLAAADAKAAKAKAKALRPWYKKKRFIFLIIIGAIVVISIATNAGKGGSQSAESGNSSESAAESAESTESAEDKLPGVGTRVEAGNFAFTVTGVECGITSVGSEYLNETAQGQFCRIGISAENIGKSPEYFFADSQKLFDTEGREFSPSTSAMIYDGENGKIWMSEINPGNTVVGGLLYDIPVGATLDYIQLDGGLFKTAKVSLK